MVDSKLLSASLLVLVMVVFVSGAIAVSSETKSGSFTFTVYGYSVTGRLTGATIAHGGSVEMLMSIDQSIPTTYGVVHITGNGVWSGETDFQAFNGAIGNVIGVVQACALFTCQNVDFTGAGTWTGTMTWSNSAGSQGSGIFQGTLNFTGQQINQTGPVPISGNWTANFQT